MPLSKILKKLRSIPYIWSDFSLMPDKIFINPIPVNMGGSSPRCLTSDLVKKYGGRNRVKNIFYHYF